MSRVIFGIALGLFIAFATLKVSAQELTYGSTGFATYTAFQEQSFQENSGTIAVNGQVFYGNFAVKGQVSNNEYEPIRRLVAEYTTPIGARDNITLQLGRIPRLNTLFSDVYGNPDEWDAAVLPLSTYNRRKVHSLAFQALDGGKISWNHNTDWGGFVATVNMGRTIEEHPCEWQMEATRRPCVTSWTFTPANDNYDVAIEARIGAAWTLLASYNKLSLGNQIVTRNRTSVTFNTLINELDYRFGRLGIRYSGEWGYIQGEHGESRLFFYDTRPGKGRGLDSTAKDDYLMGGYYVNDETTAYGGWSAGHSNTSTVYSRDTFLGVVWRDARWAYSLERHWGKGSWIRHGSTDYQWSTWVASVTVGW